ncbi:MAG: enoyl-[Lachnospiraceae bacterium]|nr:enoyl-[acyl-carrier-protein] reductase FabK [Lachnospiraceae bacterium]MBQ4308248.1 enoyl-[acyl-carrier-protein] reductase FabK [Lachnospiraceae bacterium]
MRSEICEMLGIRYPVFQGGMAWIADGKLAAAVSEGGGLGIIAAGNAPADYVREQVRIARSLTSRPFGVNIMLMSPFADEIAQMVVEEHVSVVTTGAGNPGKYMDAWKAAGIRVIPVVASVGMAKLMTRLGASALIAEGGESGGHVGELTTMVLVPQVCDATTLPVIAAGGIADGRGFAAAVMLGACGVQMGTRFLSAEECSVHPVYKEKVLKANDLCTMVTGRRLGHAVRSLRTPFSRGYEKAEYGGMPDDELEALGTGALRLAAKEGDAEHGCFLAGQIAGLVNREQPAREIIREVMEEAEACLRGASARIEDAASGGSAGKLAADRTECGA